MTLAWRDHCRMVRLTFALAHGTRPCVRLAIAQGIRGFLATVAWVLLQLGLATDASAGSDGVRATADFLPPAMRAQQDDPSRHPGWLWVDAGEAEWSRPPANGVPSCAGCHGDIGSMRGLVTRLPAVGPGGKLLNLEGHINRCRTVRQGQRPHAYESEPLLSLTAAIAQRSRGLPMAVAVDGPAAPFHERGRVLYETRQGQLNLACTQCHDDHAGRRLRGDLISSGLGTGYPAYRLEWSGLGSLHRRLRACSLGLRATIFEAGSPEYLALELHLAHRARGLPVEAPGLRR